MISPLKISVTECESWEGVILQLDSNFFSSLQTFFSMQISIRIKDHRKKIFLMLSRTSQIIFHNVAESFFQLQCSFPIQD